MADRDAPVGGRLLTELSNAMVAVHREHFGRGPGAAKSYVMDDLVICTLTDIYTPVEKTLIRAGEVERVRDTRVLHQLALKGEFTAPVERLMGVQSAIARAVGWLANLRVPRLHLTAPASITA